MFYDKFKYLSGTLYSLISKICFEIPTVSLISKIDLIKNYGDLDINFDLFLENHELETWKVFFGKKQN